MSLAAQPDDHTDEPQPTMQQMVAQQATETAQAAADDTVQYLSDEHRAAWETYRADPVTEAAQAAYTQRQNDLQPMREMVEALRAQLQEIADIYNGHMTNAHIAFQAAAHVPLYQLTRKLIELDGEVVPEDMVKVIATPE